MILGEKEAGTHLQLNARRKRLKALTAYIHSILTYTNCFANHQTNKPEVKVKVFLSFY